MSPRPAFVSGEGPVHFMGVAGAGMMSLAELLLRNGVKVTGCDLHPGPAGAALSSLGCPVANGHDPSHVESASALVVTAAVSSEHAEIRRARELGIPVLKRAQALGEWVARGKVAAVAGTHGKSTTTAMLTQILARAGMNPTGLVGGQVPDWGSHLRPGGDDLFVVEADEYDRSFHHLRPDVAVLTNLEADHLDVFNDLQGVRDAFRVFLDGVASDGFVAVCGDDHGASGLLTAVKCRAGTYGLNPGAQLRAVDLMEEEGRTRFSVLEEGEERGELTLKVPGRHNVRNALGAAQAARSMGAEWEPIRNALAGFSGVGRRFQVLGEVADVLVVDDYAHHPTEIRATLAAARNRYPRRRLVVVFQPHLYSRTRDFAQEFGMALAQADQVWVTDVYPAREEPLPGVSGVLVAQAALDAGAAEVTFHAEISRLPVELVPTLRPGDLCLTLGAGSIEFLGEDLLQALRVSAGTREVRS